MSSFSRSSGFVIKREVHLVSAPLPNAGAFTDQAAFAMPAGTKKISFYCTYTRGAAGGRPRYRILWGNGTEESRAIVIDSNSLAISGTDGQFSILQEEIVGPAPPDGNALNYLFEYDVPSGETTVRLIAAEFGATATPGTLQITLTGRN